MESEGTRKTGEVVETSNRAWNKQKNSAKWGKKVDLIQVTSVLIEWGNGGGLRNGNVTLIFLP